MKKLIVLTLLIAVACLTNHSLNAQNSIAANQGNTYLKVMQKNGKFGLSSRGSGGKTVLPIEYDKMEPIGRMYFILAKGGLTGIADSNGKIVIPLEFEKIGTPRAGVALIKKGGKFGYMRLDGNMVIAPSYDEAEEFYNEKTKRETSVAKVKNEGKFGFVDINGKVLLEPSLDEMGKETEGLILAKKDGKYGFLNPKNEWIIEPKYTSATDFKNGRSYITTETGKGVINWQGTVLIEPTYPEITGPVEGHYLLQQNAMFGFADSLGQLQTGLIFSEARPFSGGYAAVKFPMGTYKEKFKTDIDEFKDVSKKQIELEGWGFLKNDGSIMLPPLFSKVNDFKNGIAIVTLKTGKVGYIDRYGKFKTTGK